MANQTSADAPLGPIIPLVLDFRTDRRSAAPESLKEMFNLRPEVEPYFNNFKITPFEIAWLPESTVKKFKGDFRVVAQALIQKRKTEKFTLDDQTLDRPEDTLRLLGIQSENDSAPNRTNEVLDNVEARG